MIKIEIFKRIAIAEAVFHVYLFIEYLITKRLVSWPIYLFCVFMLMIVVQVVYIETPEEQMAKSSVYNVLKRASQMDVGCAGANINMPEIAGVIALRDTPFTRELLGTKGYREIKIAIADDCFMEGIGVLASRIDSYEMVDGIDVVTFLSDAYACITSDMFFGIRRMSSLEKDDSDLRPWKNVYDYDESGTAMVTPYIVPVENPDMELFNLLKEWRNRHIE